jgi:hypothetical protein
MLGRVEAVFFCLNYFSLFFGSNNAIYPYYSRGQFLSNGIEGLGIPLAVLSNVKI